MQLWHLTAAATSNPMMETKGPPSLRPHVSTINTTAVPTSAQTATEPRKAEGPCSVVGQPILVLKVLFFGRVGSTGDWGS